MTETPALLLSDMGFRRVAKVSEGPHNVAKLSRGGMVDLVIDTPFGRDPRRDGGYGGRLSFNRAEAAVAADVR